MVQSRIDSPTWHVRQDYQEERGEYWVDRGFTVFKKHFFVKVISIPNCILRLIDGMLGK